MSYAVSRTFARPHADVVADVRAALAAQGFGVITEIDMQATLKTKIDADIEPTLILGACSPRHAQRALAAEPSVGLLLPCNVVVRATGDTTVVEAIDTAMMVEVTGTPAMKEIADEVGAKLEAMLDAIPA